MDDDSIRRSKTALWGVFLILLGAAFLAERYGMIEVPAIWRLWPIVMFVIGVEHLMERRPGSAVMFMLMGCVFLAATNDWWELDYGNSWPLLIVAVGVGIVIKAFTREDEKRRKPGGVNIVLGEVPREK